MRELLGNPMFMMWLSITAISVTPIVCVFWWKIRRAELETSLKLDMLERGMSAEEIRTVLAASSRRARCGRSRQVV